MREHSFLRARSLFVATRTADGGIERILFQSFEKRAGFQGTAATRNAEFQGMSAFGNRFFIAMDNQAGADRLREFIAECQHLLEFVSGVDVQERERYWSGIERFTSQMYEDAGILADR